MCNASGFALHIDRFYTSNKRSRDGDQESKVPAGNRGTGALAVDVVTITADSLLIAVDAAVVDSVTTSL